MNGNRYLLDTNSIIALLDGNNEILGYLQDAQWIGVSVITQIEFLVFPDLSDEDKDIFSQFLRRVDVIELSPKQDRLIDLIVKLRQQYRVKLPDAIIAATAIQYDASIITADKQFQNIRELEVIFFA